MSRLRRCRSLGILQDESDFQDDTDEQFDLLGVWRDRRSTAKTEQKSQQNEPLEKHCEWSSDENEREWSRSFD